MSVKLNDTEWVIWEDVRKEIYTTEEIIESDIRAALIGKQNKDKCDKKSPYNS